MAKDRSRAGPCSRAMFVLWLVGVLVAMGFETERQPRARRRAAPTSRSPPSRPGGNIEGKEVRFGPAASGLFAGVDHRHLDRRRSTRTHDSFTPLGGAVPLVNMMLGEVSPGGVGAGLYGMLVFALLAVFIAGLMVGRTPEYLGKKIQAAEMKLVVLYILAVPLVVLGFTGASVVIDTALALDPQPRARTA